MSGGENGGHNGGSETGGNYAKGMRPGSVGVSPLRYAELVWTAEQAGRALAWIQAHYGKPTFQCPTEPAGDEGGN